MQRFILTAVCLASCLIWCPSTNGFPGARRTAGPRWHSDYLQASAEAEKQGKMLLVYFEEQGTSLAQRRLERETLGDGRVACRLCEYVCVRVPLCATLCLEGQQTRLLDHPCFAEMLGQAGVAIVDYAHKDQPYYGYVVSVFPILNRHWYTAENMLTILDLPPGTLTQRTLVYAVRVHPERPQSTSGQLDPMLAAEAESHSQYQANIRVQGHHTWNVRFQRIGGMLPAGLSAKEVCAESWPGENLVEAAIECVRCWRLSSGHWSAVAAPQPLFGYDMKRGANGIWYATGVFGSYQR